MDSNILFAGVFSDEKFI